MPYPVRAGVVSVLVATVLGLVLSACGASSGEQGNDSGSAQASPTESPSGGATTTASPTADPSAAGLPACRDVWRAGKTLPNRYAGCADSGTAVAADDLACSSGQSIVTYAERFYAVRGGPIRRVADVDRSADYREMVETCRG